MPRLKAEKCPNKRCSGPLALPGRPGTLFTWFAPPVARCQHCGRLYKKARNGRWVSMTGPSQRRR